MYKSNTPLAFAEGYFYLADISSWQILSYYYDMSYFVYILECADTTLYVGSTNNIETRLHHHNNTKQGAHYTKIRRPVVLKYSEEVRTLSEARKREAELKRLKRSEKMDLIKKIANT